MAQVADGEPHRSDDSLKRILKRFQAIEPLIGRDDRLAFQSSASTADQPIVV
jgi:hypothetical protein